MILHELQGKETARHKGGRGGKKELTGGESSDELTRTKAEQTEEEKGVEVRGGRGGGEEEGEGEEEETKNWGMSRKGM
jgi:hypothetical protein